MILHKLFPSLDSFLHTSCLPAGKKYLFAPAPDPPRLHSHKLFPSLKMSQAQMTAPMKEHLPQRDVLITLENMCPQPYFSGTIPLQLGQEHELSQSRLPGFRLPCPLSRWPSQPPASLVLHTSPAGGIYPLPHSPPTLLL